MKRILPFILFFSFLNSWTQTRVSGVVKDPAGKFISGANVVFSNSAEGVTTSEQGEFSLVSAKDHASLTISFLGFHSRIFPLQKGNNLNLEIILEEQSETLAEVLLFQGKTSKKNNPAIDILRKIWENRRHNGVKKFAKYEFRKYEKLEFDLNSIDSSITSNKAFNGMEFIFDNVDTSALTGKSFLPLFINESIYQVYGENRDGNKREDLLGNKNSGFNENQILIGSLKDLYLEYDIYENHLRLFDKNFVSPLSTTGIDTYNYILKDSAFIGDKWCYNIVYYPRRENELTFRGNFWVNDTTWAIKEIHLEMEKNANINWVNEVYLEQQYQVLNDSVFLLTRDFLMADFSFEKKESARGIYGKKTVLYDNFVFDRERDKDFYREKETRYKPEVYNRDVDFWVQNRLEPLNNNEAGIYVMLDTLQTIRSFKRLYRLADIAATGYVEFEGWDLGPVHNIVGFNEVEGWRIRAGARTYFGQNDPWRIEAYTAYGFRDHKVKYGLQGKVMLDQSSRLILSAGYRDDVEQLGASLTNTTDVLGRSLASSSLINVGDNDKLSRIRLTMAALEIEPLPNFNIRLSASHRHLESASPAFSLAWFDRENNQINTQINQMEISSQFAYYPGRKTTGFGVERNVVNSGNFPSFFVNYSLGAKNLFKSDFDYRKLQVFYDQPWWIGGIGKANLSLEAGKTFGTVPLGLLSVVPGNQTFFAIYNAFPLLNFYEFVSDTYVSAHFEHNFNGSLFARIPGLRALNLREIVGVRGVWGEVSSENKNLDASGLHLMAPNEDPYWEYSAGVGNIFKFIRIDAHFRGNYFDNPKARSFGVTARLGFHF